MHLDVFSLTQRGGLDGVQIYVTVFRAKDIVERYAIDRWMPENPEGYQRLPSERRLLDKRGSAVRYLARELGSFPTGILLNVRGTLEYQKEKDLGWFSYGQLETSDEKFWLIDGQHRVEALKRAIERNQDFEDYPVIASIMKLPDKFDEMMLFYIVNKRQKSVPTDLVYRHLQRMLWKKGSEWLYDLEGARGVRTGLATEAVDILNVEPASPWHGRIQIVNQQKNDDYIIKDSMLIRTIGDILKEKVFDGMPIREFASLLIFYWNALFQLYPECFEQPGSYTLLSSPGVPVFHKLFPSIYARCVRENMLHEDGMETELEKLMESTPEHPNPEFRKPITAEFWSRNFGPSIALSKTIRNKEELYRNLQEKIRLVEARTVQ